VLAALAAVGAGSAACDLSPPAASVDGSAVSRSQLDSELLSISQSAYAQCALEMQGLNLPSGSGGAGDFTVPADLAGVPAISIPTELLDGLPLGMQIIGRAFDEETVLRVSQVLESAAAFTHLPSFIA